ncbi:MAG TPA: carboxypeptidase-like regulatory domain-containing protein, partial [Bryobacteraceae bacterium]|nr:carboxypeptidase-like regulatory domain-containing protein [Bryobacteraceae bacterium]
MIVRRFFRSFSAAALLAALCAAAWGQNITGTILGMVKDASGAVISGAEVVVLNVETNQQVKVATSPLGIFEAPYLRPGRYQVRVSGPGFKTAVREGVDLQLESRLRLDFTLELGEVSTTVAVTAETPLIESNSSSLGQVVTTRTIEELPIRGRNVFDLVGLAPGVQVNPRAMGAVASTGNNAAPLFVFSDISINGGRYRSNDFTLDGVSVVLPENNNYAVGPTPDSAQEFKVQTNSYGPEFGRSGGGVINVVTKGGTNTLHGTLYEFFRNDRLRANNFFANARGQKRGIFHFNMFGVAVGGPVIKNKTFFFAEYQGHRESNSFGGRSTTLPTMAQRQGDFSDLRNNLNQAVSIYDPFTTAAAAGGGFVRQPFAGNSIPQSRIDPVAAKLTAFLPPPNRPGEGPALINNWAYAPKETTRSDQWSARIDHRFSDSHSLFGRVTQNKGLDTNTGEFGTLADTAMGAIENHAWNAVINGTLLLSPTRVVNYRYGFSRRFEGRTPIHQGQVNIAALGFPQYLTNVFDPKYAMFPSINPANYATFGQTPGDPIRKGNDLHTWVLEGSQIHSRHTFKFGTDLRLYLQSPLQGFPVQHSYSFARSQTQGPNPLTASLTSGDGFASLLTGFGSGSIKNNAALAIRNLYSALYFNDEVKLGRLTVNVGVRWEYEQPRTERYNRFATFDFSRSFPVQVAALPNLRGVLTHPGQGGEPRGHFDSAYRNFGPRLGLAWRASNALAIRAGYGIVFSPRWGTTSGSGFGISGEEITTNWVSSVDGVTPLNTLSNPFPTGVLARPTSPAEVLQLGQNLDINDRGSKNNTYVQQWNFGIQRQLPANMVVEVAYAGNKGTRLPVGLIYNQLDPQFQALGAQLNQQVANPFFGLAPTGVLSTPTVSRGQLLRPYPQYGTISTLNPARGQNMGSSVYHSANLRLEKRFSHGLNFVFAYTRAKLIDDASGRIFGENGNPPPIQNNYDLRGERSLSEGDVSNRLVINHTVDLPFGHGKKLLGSAPRGLDLLVGGWSASGTISIVSGFPVWMQSTGNAGVFSSRLRPNSTGKPAGLDGSVQSRLNRYFDTSQFTLPAPFTFGNVSRTLPDVRAPGRRSYDLALTKTFRIREPVSLLFRAESFNLSNTPYFGGVNSIGSNPGNNLGTPTFGVITDSTG